MNTGLQKNHQADLSRNGRSKGLTGLSATKQKTLGGKCPEDQEILRCVADAWNEWQEACACFEHAYEEKLVDYYTYKMKACEARYSYYVGVAKGKGLAGNVFTNSNNNGVVQI